MKQFLALLLTSLLTINLFALKKAEAFMAKIEKIQCERLDHDVISDACVVMLTNLEESRQDYQRVAIVFKDYDLAYFLENMYGNYNKLFGKKTMVDLNFTNKFYNEEIIDALHGGFHPGYFYYKADFYDVDEVLTVWSRR